MPEKLKKFLESVSDDEAATLWCWLSVQGSIIEMRETLLKFHYVLAHPPGQQTFPLT